MQQQQQQSPHPGGQMMHAPMLLQNIRQPMLPGHPGRHQPLQPIQQQQQQQQQHLGHQPQQQQHLNYHQIHQSHSQSLSGSPVSHSGSPHPQQQHQHQHHHHPQQQLHQSPNQAMNSHESPIPQQQQHHMMRQTLTPSQPSPMMTQQQHTPPMHQQQTPPMHQQQQHMMHQTVPPQNQTYHQLPPHPPTPLSASPIHHPGSMHSNHSSQTNISLQQPPSRPSTGPPPPMQHVQPGPHHPHHHHQQQHHHHMGVPSQGHHQVHFNGLQQGITTHPHHQNSHGPTRPPSLQSGMLPQSSTPGPSPSAAYGVTPPPSGPLPLPPHQMHHHNHQSHHHMASQPSPTQTHHQMHHNSHHAPQPQMHPIHPSMDRHGSPFYPNIPQTEYRIIELDKRLQNRPRSRGPISPLPSSITDDTFWWERFACDFFDDDSTLTIRVPGEKQPTEYTIGRTLIPRFFKTYFDGGVSDFSIKLHHTEELNHPNNPNWVMLKCDHTDITTKNVYRHQSSSVPTYVVVHTEGQLTLEFCSNRMLDTLLIKSWRFHTRQCHEFIDRSMTAGGMSPYLNEPVTRHGLTKRTINYLKMCMIMEPMQDLMLHHRQTNGQIEPKACLKHLLLNRFNVKPTVEEKKQKRKRGARAANTGAAKKSKANNTSAYIGNESSANSNLDQNIDSHTASPSLLQQRQQQHAPPIPAQTDSLKVQQFQVEQTSPDHNEAQQRSHQLHQHHHSEMQVKIQEQSQEKPIAENSNQVNHLESQSTLVETDQQHLPLAPTDQQHITLASTDQQHLPLVPTDHQATIDSNQHGAQESCRGDEPSPVVKIEPTHEKESTRDSIKSVDIKGDEIADQVTERKNGDLRPKESMNEGSNESFASTKISSKQNRRRSSEHKETLREGLMRTSDFVVAMKDLKSEHPALWRITTGNNLLQQFEPKPQKGLILYENTHQYAGWNPEIKRDYIGVDVKVTQRTRNQIFVEKLFLNFQKVEDVDAFYDKHFTIYLQIIISTALDSKFWESIESEPKHHDYFITSRRIIEDIVKRHKVKLSSKLKLSENVIKQIEKYPNFVVKPQTDNNEEQPCRACNTNPSTQILSFANRSYDLNSFKLVNVTGESTDDSGSKHDLCNSCLDLVKLYSSVHHMGWKLFNLAKEKVEQHRKPGKPINAILDECLKDEDWLTSIVDWFSQNIKEIQ